jgi:hypothetical protein
MPFEKSKSTVPNPTQITIDREVSNLFSCHSNTLQHTQSVSCKQETFTQNKVLDTSKTRLAQENGHNRTPVHCGRFCRAVNDVLRSI